MDAISVSTYTHVTFTINICNVDDGAYDHENSGSNITYEPVCKATEGANIAVPMYNTCINTI